MRLNLFLILMSFFGVLSTQAAPSVKEHRALVAVVNLDKMTSRKNFKFLYRWEQHNARKLIERYGQEGYQEVVVLDEEQATHENFMSELHRISGESGIHTIDVIFYLHGHSQKDHPTPELCFVSPDKKCYPSADLRDDLKPFTKLRALYSDACYGHEQNQDYLDAGFKVVAGSTDTDTNQTLDMKRFLKRWVRGESFGPAIEYANRTQLGHLMDKVMKGNSIKIVAGDASLTLDSPEDEMRLDSQAPQLTE